jgi:hypothetical protein
VLSVFRSKMQYLVPPTELGLSSPNIVVPRYQLKLHAGGQHIEMTKRHGAQEPDELSKVKFPEQDVTPGSQADTHCGSLLPVQNAERAPAPVVARSHPWVVPTMDRSERVGSHLVPR